MKSGMKNIQAGKWRILLAAISCLVISVIAVSVLIGMRGRHESYVYKETQVEYGRLTVGVTKSGSIDIGTVEQTFDLDMSALQRVETGNSESNSNMGTVGGMPAMGGMEGGLNMFGQTFGGGSLVGAGEASSLTVARVQVSVGQEVSEGDVLYELAEKSVSELEQKLQANVEKAKTDLDAVYADQVLSRQTAKYAYESSMAYGDYAGTEYDTAVQELEDAVETKRIALERAKDSFEEYQNLLKDISDSYNDAVQALENCQYSLENTSPSEAYLYGYYYELTENAQATADSLKQQKEQLENNVRQTKENVETATQNYNGARRSLEQGKLSAKQTYDLRNLAYDTAQETYDITLGYLDEDAAVQEEIYQETKEKWEEFSSYISQNAVLAKYNGVVTSVALTKGDSIHTGSALITLYDMDNVTMTVSVYEEDMTDIFLGSEANILFTAYPEDPFTAVVTEISEASADSRGNVVYEVTVTVQGDVSGLFQGMTGDITFITRQSEETLYVYKRAVITENGKSYVKVREDNGNIVKREITIGFSDGTYIQVVEGLSEGDVVLIESKVGGS
ncbi:HlyD family efflux transporter periplasmic adaptor subunit [bacterium D16-50]|nr:HlyD family efflux transporter periplasmic adaptor subunit [bacterium D16-50]